MRVALIIQIAALLLALGAAVLALMSGTYTVIRSNSDGVTQELTMSAIDFLGPAAILIVAMPVLIVAAPLIVRGKFLVAVSLGSAGALLVWAVVGSMTVGLLFIPAAIAGMAAALLVTAGRVTGRPGMSPT